MRTKNLLTRWTLTSFCALVFAVAPLSSNAQDAVPCPFADDSVIIMDSPNLVAKVVCSGLEKSDFSEEVASLEKELDKADQKLQDALNKGDLPRKQLDYLISFAKKDSGESSATRALLKTYARYFDYVVLAAELPEEIKDVKAELPYWLTLTVIFNENPSVIDPRKLFDANDVEIIRENDKELVGKLIIRDKGTVKAEVFFGGTKIKDVDKYAVVAAASLDKVEKKISRFQQSNEFVVNNLGDGIFAKRTVKRAVFEKIANEVKKSNDERAKVCYNILNGVNTLTLSAVESENGFVQKAVVEATNAENAKTFNDLAAGGLAAVKLAIKNKENKKAEEELALELLNKVELSYAEGEINVSGQVEVGFDFLRKVVDFAKEKHAKK